MAHWAIPVGVAGNQLRRICIHPTRSGKLIETLAILGGDSGVDIFIARTRGNINDQRAIRETLKVKRGVRSFLGPVLQRP
ncbi:MULTISPECIES: hypothetical protein [unclassified Streptomyces]|uniref:hypothetical protein n=1 Tax=unclassified Streptomyces TaxID=2593676 RepID=UPI0037F51FDC